MEFDCFSGAAGGFVSRYQFSKADGVQLAGAGLYNYYVDGLAIPYQDLDTSSSPTPPSLHVAIQNVDTVAKSAGAGGAVSVTIWVEPMGEGTGRS